MLSCRLNRELNKTQTMKQIIYVSAHSWLAKYTLKFWTGLIQIRSNRNKMNKKKIGTEHQTFEICVFYFSLIAQCFFENMEFEEEKILKKWNWNHLFSLVFLLVKLHFRLWRNWFLFLLFSFSFFSSKIHNIFSKLWIKHRHIHKLKIYWFHVPSWNEMPIITAITAIAKNPLRAIFVYCFIYLLLFFTPNFFSSTNCQNNYLITQSKQNKIGVMSFTGTINWLL